MTFREFLFKAKFIPEISRCFGLFDFMYFKLVAPYKTKEFATSRVEVDIPVAHKVFPLYYYHHFSCYYLIYFVTSCLYLHHLEKRSTTKVPQKYSGVKRQIPHRYETRPN